MFFAFNATNPNEIVWDPKLGVVSVSAMEALSQLLGSNAPDLGLPINMWVVFITITSIALISRRLKKMN